MIRHMQAGDIDEVLAMFLAEYEEMPGPLAAITLNLERARAVIESSLEGGDDHLIVSDMEGELRGLLWFVVGDFIPWSSDVVAIDQVVYVKPAYRGTYTGAALAKHYTRLAHEMGARAAYLSAGSGINDEGAAALYHALGYQPAGKQMMRSMP